MQRKAIKMSRNIRCTTPNIIVYAESGLMPVRPQIYKRQLQMFKKMKAFSIKNPTSSISIIFKTAVDKNTAFLNHYKNLDIKFENIDECHNFYLTEQKCDFF